VDDILAGCDNVRLGKVVVLDLTSLCPPAIPALTVGLNANLDAAKGTAMSVLRVADAANWDTAGQMREVLRHVLSVLLDVYGERANMVYLQRFITEGSTEALFRERTLAQCSREVSDSRDFCNRLKADLESSKGSAPLKNSAFTASRRVQIYLENRHFRRCLALPQLGPRLDLGKLLSGAQAVLVPARKSELQGAMEILGTLLMWMVVNTFMGRSEKKDRKQAAVILDEFATLAGSEAGELTTRILAEARKYGASAILAMQFLAQLPETVRAEVKTNTLTKIVMNLPDDGEARAATALLAHPELTPADIQAIERFHFYGRLTEHKTIHPACYLAALPPIFLSEPEQAVRVDIPLLPHLSTETTQVYELSKTATDPDRPEEVKELIDRLCAMETETFHAVVDEMVAANRYTAFTLLAEPDLEPDKVKRAKLVSGYLYGLQWWLRDAYYNRLRNEGKEKPKTRSVRTVSQLSEQLE
jgi:hypothetical protein